MMSSYRMAPLALAVVLAIVLPIAYGQRASMMAVTETKVDLAYASISGLAFDSKANSPGVAPIYYAIPDDARDPTTLQNLNPPMSGRRYYDISIVFGPQGTMETDPLKVFALPEIQPSRPEGMDFCGQFIYFADNAPDASTMASRIRRFSPVAGTIDTTYNDMPRGEPYTIEGVTVSKTTSVPRLYNILGRPASTERQDAVTVGEWIVTGSGLNRAFLYPLDSTARATDILYDQDGQTFLVLEVTGSNLGSEPSQPAATGNAPRPTSVALYAFQIPAQDVNFNVLPARTGTDPQGRSETDISRLSKQLVGTFTMTVGPNGQDVLTYTPNGGTPSSLPYPTATQGVLPFWDGMTFGPTMSDGSKTLILVSDNNVDQLVPTRYLTMSYTPPSV